MSTYIEEVKNQMKEKQDLETDTVKITYFKKRENALKWENPESYNYIFLNVE